MDEDGAIIGYIGLITGIIIWYFVGFYSFAFMFITIQIVSAISLIYYKQKLSEIFTLKVKYDFEKKSLPCPACGPLVFPNAIIMEMVSPGQNKIVNGINLPYSWKRQQIVRFVEQADFHADNSKKLPAKSESEGITISFSYSKCPECLGTGKVHYWENDSFLNPDSDKPIITISTIAGKPRTKILTERSVIESISLSDEPNEYSVSASIFQIYTDFLIALGNRKKNESFATSEETNINQPLINTKDDVNGTLSYNGNTYHTVTIGTQEWTVENLKTSFYNDGTAIVKETDGNSWSKLKIGAYCAYENNETNVTTYGYLYNLETINSGKLAPTTGGWRVPTDSDWEKLVEFTSGSDVAGTKLKANSGWNDNGNGTDNYGFRALPGGQRTPDGNFRNLGNFGCWWSSTTDESLDAWYAWSRYMNSFRTKVEKSDDHKLSGFSVRLVRDK